jgi:hypothetical protein
VQKSQTEAERDNKWYLAAMADVASVLSTRSGWTWAHSGRVARYAILFGARVGLDQQQMLALQCASLLHDIGKLKVPEEVLNKVSKLSLDEWYTITKHPMASALIIKSEDIALQIAGIVRSHHEWFNGEGYPLGLSGDAIPIAARILSLADAYDAMSSPRPYRPALLPGQILEQIEGGAGKQFDPVLIKRLRPLLATGLGDQPSKGIVTVATDEIKLVQQFWFALYPYNWDIQAVGSSQTNAFEGWPTSVEAPAGNYITIAVLDGRCSLTQETLDSARRADGLFWVYPPTGVLPALPMPLDLESVLDQVQQVESRVKGTSTVTGVLLADPYQLFRQALKHSLNEQTDMRVVGAVASASEFREARKHLSHNVAVVASDLLIGTRTTGPLKPDDVLLSQSEAIAEAAHHNFGLR